VTKTFILLREGVLAVDPDEIEPASSREPVDRNVPDTTGGDLRTPMPGGGAPTPRAGGQGTGGASGVVTAIAAAIINSSMATHSTIITVIVTISVLTAALAWSERVRR
jgi:hypothetical protein